ncbi:sensor histidine kinase [Brachybacterium sp. DNPG3]
MISLPVHLVAIALCAVWLSRVDASVPGLVLGTGALLCWAVVQVLRARGRRGLPAEVAAGGAILLGTAALGPTAGASLPAAIVALVALPGNASAPMPRKAAVLLLGAGAAIASLALSEATWQDTAAMLGGLALGATGGVARAQRDIARARSQQLAEQEARVAMARDLHDVLAHGLGGTVVQLDAIEALLEAGRVEEAGRRVALTRRLAVQGLGEARAAVAALREVAPLPERLATVLAQVRAQGAQVDAEILLDAEEPVSDEAALALVRLVQEGCANARQHAPGAPIALRIGRRGGTLTARLATALPADPPADERIGPRGNGLPGLRERFARLGGRVRAGRRGDEFVLEAMLPAVPAPRLEEEGS